jgi:hypothetical protein
MADDTPTPPPAQTPPGAIPEAGTPEARVAARRAQLAPPNRNRAFVAVFGITVLTLAFFLGVFFFFPGLDGGSSEKAAQIDSVRTSLRTRDSLDAAALERYNAVRDTGGAVRGYTIPIDSAMQDVVRTTGDSAGAVLPLR